MFWELELALMENNVAMEVIEKIKRDLQKQLVDTPIKRNRIEETINESLKSSIESLFEQDDFDLLSEIKSKNPMKIPDRFVGDFLRGFFDADGNVHLRPLGKTKIKGIECNSFDTPRVKMTLANKKLIEWISQLLRELGIENNINKTYAMCKGKKFDCWTIFISNTERIEKFAYLVGFDTYKEEILYRGLKCASKNLLQYPFPNPGQS